MTRVSTTGPTLIDSGVAPSDARDLQLSSLRRVAYRLLVESEHLLQSVAALTDNGERQRFLDDARHVRETAAALLVTRPRPNGDNGHVAVATDSAAKPFVLVVDDDPALRTLLVRRLTQLGFEPVDAEDGERALELARQRRPDLVLTDLNMPRLNGLGLLKALKGDAATRDVPVIVLSGEDDLTQVVECIRNGAEDYVAKPYEWSVLNARVGASVERKRLRDAERAYRERVDRLTAAAEAVERETYTSDMLSLLRMRDDELGQLARVFDRMVVGMRLREERLQHRLEQLRKDARTARTTATRALDAEDDSRLHAGETLAGRFEILGVLGRGGMGSVYHARDRELGEEVALKMVRPDVIKQDPSIVERLKSEIRLQRKLSHRNIVRAYDLGEHNGSYFITMEYVPGVTVADLLDRRGRLSVASTLAIGVQMADALAVAHDAQIVHRDIKPANLMVDESGLVKVMDFGIALFAAREDKLTAGGFIVGTPEYMAPEQLIGGQLTACTDLFSAGIVLYECLTGKPPIDADTPQSIMNQLTQRGLPPLRERVSGIPPALDSLVMQLLAFQPADRPQSARAVADQLSEIEHTARDDADPDPIIATVDLQF